MEGRLPPGTRVYICVEHRWGGRYGTVVCQDRTLHRDLEPSYRVQLDGTDCVCLVPPGQLKLLSIPPGS
jgi:hypothetical protein